MFFQQKERIVGQGMSPLGSIPEGLGDGSQAVYCLVPMQKGGRPVGNGMIVRPSIVDCSLDEEGSAEVTAHQGLNQTVPTGRVARYRHTRHFVPGYLHLVPTGQLESTVCKGNID